MCCRRRNNTSIIWGPGRVQITLCSKGRTRWNEFLRIWYWFTPQRQLGYHCPMQLVALLSVLSDDSWCSNYNKGNHLVLDVIAPPRVKNLFWRKWEKNKEVKRTKYTTQTSTHAPTVPLLLHRRLTLPLGSTKWLHRNSHYCTVPVAHGYC